MTTDINIKFWTVCLIQDGDKVLLLDRQHDHFKGFIPPGGKVEFPEGFVEAAIREVREETGLEVKKLSKLEASEMKERIVVSWSGGKDSTFALYKIIKDDQYIVDSLLTTITEGYNRISVHGVREALLEKQAESLGIPLRKMYIPQECSHDIYKARMDEQLRKIKGEGIDTIMFGDIFLEDVRTYREDLIAQQGMKAIFPLWGLQTDRLVQDFLTLGFKTITTCIDTEKLSDRFLGSNLDEAFINALPEGVDPCGENGKFHTFTYAGPIFQKAVAFTIGEKVDRGRFHFCELVEEVL